MSSLLLLGAILGVMGAEYNYFKQLQAQWSPWDSLIEQERQQAVKSIKKDHRIINYVRLLMSECSGEVVKGLSYKKDAGLLEWTDRGLVTGSPMKLSENPEVFKGMSRDLVRYCANQVAQRDFNPALLTGQALALSRLSEVEKNE